MSLLHDARVAVRAVTRARFVSGLAVLAFALGIGVTTAVFSIFSGVLLEPLPYPEPGRLVMVYDTQPACRTCPASFPKYHDWKARNRVFAAIGGSMQSGLVMTGTGEPVQAAAISATASLAQVFGVQPRLGRWFTEEEDRPGGAKVVVLTHAFWTTHFNADPSVLGRRVLLDGAPHEIIGVMPPGFDHRRGELFVPLQRALDPSTRGSHFLLTYARLKDGVTVEQAASEMRALGRALAAEFADDHGIDVRSYYEAIVGNIRTPLTVLLGAVFLVLLIACANVANLLLAAGMARRRELAIRLALGARTKELARQLTTESVLLALTGGALGVLLAYWVVGTFVVLAGTQLPRAAGIGIDARVLAFAGALSLAVGVFCGLWPLVLLRAGELAAAVREGDTRTVSGAGGRFGGGLVVAEIALAFALLAGAGLLVKNLVLLHARDAGIRTERVVAFNVAPAGPRYDAPEQQLAFYRELHARLAATGGVESAGMISHLPMRVFGWNSYFNVEGASPWRPEDAPLVEHRWYHGDYLETVGIRLIQGRLLDDRDGAGSRTVLINQAMARKFWPGGDPIGRRFGHGSDTSTWFEVVGVVSDVRSFGLAVQAPYEFYRTIAQDPFARMTVVIRTSSDDPASIVPTARRIVSSIDPSTPIARVQTMEEVVSDSVGQPRLVSALSGLFGALAGVLAMVGVYGVMAYNVRRQRREFGIRLALGADQRVVRRLVVGRGMMLAATGIVLGAAGAALLTRALGTMLHDVEPLDPAVFAATAAALAGVVLAASYPPARAAGRVDAMVVLRDS
jgi:predicted permease